MEHSAKQSRWIDEEHGQALVALARQTIMERLGLPVDPGEKERLARLLAHPSLQARQGTFVTLEKQGALRGCIGSLVGTCPLVEGVRRNAINAAFHDPRFPPLTVDELEQLSIEVSVLSEPRPLTYTDAADLIAKLRKGVDGVIVSRGGLSATFLPQVWEQLPDPQLFLSHLCLKAGLPAQAWQEGDLEVQTYQVQSFHEQR